MSAEDVGLYTHPGDPLHVLRAYRRFLLARKSQWAAHGSGLPEQRRRRVRAHMHYLAYVREYLYAKRLCFRFVLRRDEFFVEGSAP